MNTYTGVCHACTEHSCQGKEVGNGKGVSLNH